MKTRGILELKLCLFPCAKVPIAGRKLIAKGTRQVDFPNCKFFGRRHAQGSLCILSSCKIGNPALIKEAIGFVLDNQKLWEDIVQFCPTECSPPNMSSVASGKPEVFDLTSDSSSEDESGLPYKQLGEDRERNFLSEIEEIVDELLKQALHSSSNFSLQISMNQLETMDYLFEQHFKRQTERSEKRKDKDYHKGVEEMLQDENE